MAARGFKRRTAALTPRRRRRNVARMYLGRVVGTVVATRKYEGLEGAKLRRVKGTVVATIKHPTFAGRKLLVVQPLDEAGSEIGDSFIAVDMVQAGEGDVVLINQEGNGARQLLKMGAQVPIRSLIVAIV